MRHIMKRNHSLLLSLLLVLGFGLMPVPKVFAQYGNPATATEKTTDQNKPEEKSESAPADAEAKVSDAIKAAFPDAWISTTKKLSTAGTNDIYGIEFTNKLGRMRAIVATDGTIMETEEPGDIKTFPPG